jgi:hypothetical protein
MVRWRNQQIACLVQHQRRLLFPDLDRDERIVGRVTAS